MSDTGRPLADRDIRLAAQVVAGELARRRQFGHPIPQWMRDLHDTLDRAVCADKQPPQPVLQRLKTTTELAREWGCHPMTVRRRAKAAGARKIGAQWIFDEEDT